MKIVTACALHAVSVGCQKWRHVHHLTAKNGEVRNKMAACAEKELPLCLRNALPSKCVRCP